MSTTIRGSFSERLPYWPARAYQCPQGGTPGIETARCEPPTNALVTPLTAWTSKADRTLNLNPVREVLGRKYLPEIESAVVVSEGDVVACSAVYLNNPVHIALEKAKGTGYTHRSEDTRTGSTRADKAYYRGGVPYAVLDYKKPGYLNQSQLEASIPRSVQEYQDNIAMAMSTGSSWEPGIGLIMQQAVHYSYKFSTPFVALYDWNTLVLLFLSEREDRSAGEYCYMTIVKDSRDFRKAFLGFLLLADEYRTHEDAVRQKLRPAGKHDFAAIYRANTEPSDKTTRGNRPDYSMCFQESFGGQSTAGESSQSHSQDHYSGARGRQVSRSQYYPPISGERRGDKDRYAGGRSTEHSKDRSRSKKRDVSRLDPRSKSQYPENSMQVSYGQTGTIGMDQGNYYPYTSTSTTSNGYSSGSGNTVQLDGQGMSANLAERGRKEKHKNKDHKKEAKSSWFSR